MTAMLLAIALHAAITPAQAPSGRAAAGLVNDSSPHYDLEQLYTQGRMDEGLAEARRRLEANPDDVDLHWHVARFIFEVAERFERTDKTIDKVDWYEDMIAVSEKGLALDPDNAHLHFALGIAKGRLGTTRGVLSSLFMAKDVESSWLRTARSSYVYSSLGGEEQLPCDAWLCLGIFYRLVPDSWLVEMIAGTRGDLDKSVEVLERANECSPNRILVLKELGVAQICAGRKQKDDALIQAGRANLLRGRSIPATSATQRTDLKHIDMVLAKPELACGYSRDGQQDLDESKLQQPGVKE